MEATPPSDQAHEFGPYENEVIGKAGKWVGYWSWIAILTGILSIVGAVFEAEGRIAGLVMGVVYLAVGTYFRGAATAMNEVVRTAGNDVRHLMTALDRLASAFKVMVLLVFVGVLLALAVGLFVATGG